jgi:beta-glucosidase
MAGTSMSRRTLLGAGSASLAGAALMANGARASAAPIAKPARAFPQGFLWGAATAGHQVEGNNVASDMWVLEHVRPTLFVEPSGDACDHLNRWQEDLDIAKAIGLNAYRFSIEWSRIEPAPGQFSVAYLDHYARVIDGCHQRGLHPVVTFSHWSVPLWFAAQGNFQSPDGPDLFARFCEKAARRLASGMAYAVTLNEPDVSALIAQIHMPSQFADGMRASLAAAAAATGSPRFASALFAPPEAMAQQVQAHIKGYQAIKSARSDLPVGVGLAIEDDQAIGDPAARDAKRQSVYAPWFEVTRTHGDFIGVQNYTRRIFDAQGVQPPSSGALMSDDGRENYPASLGNAVRYAYQATGKPVLITENGIAAKDDSVRQRYIPLALAGLHAAVADGVPVLGYIHWSLLDNFEWVRGYGMQFGLVAVDRTSFVRTVKPSAAVLGRIARANGLAASV